MEVVSLVVSLAIVFVGGFSGSLITRKNIPTWYKTIRKPRLNPPNFVFPVVWTLLYIMMGISAWRVFLAEGKQWSPALTVYAVQLVLNWLWTPLFFGMHRLGLAAVEIIALLISIYACIFLFYPIDIVAAILFIPYAAWVSFASYLNISIWLLNRGGKSSGSRKK